MRLEITRVEGLRNDLLLRLDRAEVDHGLLSVANRDRLMRLPGIPRHRAATAAEAQGLWDSRVPLEQHLERLGLVDPSGKASRRAVAISNRNLGTNHGHVAWQRQQSPRIFVIQEDPADRPFYSCLCIWRSGSLSLDDLRFDMVGDRAHAAEDGRDVSDELEWATAGQRVLRSGQVPNIDEIADHFYDVRHVLAYDHHREGGERIRRDIYQGYPAEFRSNVRTAWSELGVPRARYLHNAIGVSSSEVVVLQREGTVEEIGRGARGRGRRRRDYSRQRGRCLLGVVGEFHARRPEVDHEFNHVCDGPVSDAAFSRLPPTERHASTLICRDRGRPSTISARRDHGSAESVGADGQPCAVAVHVFMPRHG